MAIAIFDFDGTIISRDSLPDFLIQACGRKAFLLRLPWIILLKGAALTGILSTHRAKELVISSFLRGMKTEDFQQACLEYASRIPGVFPRPTVKEVRRYAGSAGYIRISPPRRCMYMATVPATKNCSPLQMSPIINHSTINKHIL